MKVKINYDYSQQALMGKQSEVEVGENTTLGELLAQIDARLAEIGKERDIDTSDLCMVGGNELKCIVAVNKSPPESLEYRLKSGDEIDVLFGFCGG